MFTIHAGEYLVGEYIESHLEKRKWNVWIPSKDTGIDLLVTDQKNQRTVSLQVKFSKDYLPSILYTNVVITAWCEIVFYICTSDCKLSDLIPRMIWSYVIATGTLASMAMKEGNDENATIGATLAVLFAQIGYMFGILRVVILRENAFHNFVMAFVAFMIVATLVQWVLPFLISDFKNPAKLTS